MEKFALTIAEGRYIIGFDEQQHLVFFHAETLPEDYRMHKRLLASGFFPLTKDHLLTLVQKNIGLMSLAGIQADLSFERFWSAYGNKVGRKDRAKKLWSLLSDTERNQVLLAIPRYKYWLSSRPIEMVYPETFLSQRRWENDFSK